MKSLVYTVDYQIINDYAEKASNSAKSLKVYLRHSEEINTIIRKLNIPIIQSQQGIEQLRLF